MPKIVTHGSIGTNQPLEVREGHTLVPQTAVLSFRSGRPVDPTGATLVLRLFRREGDSEPLIDPGFDPPVRLADAPDGRPRFLISQSRALLDAAILAAGPLPPPPKASRLPPTLQLYWTCSYLDADGRLFALYYGKFTVYLGAAGE